MNKPFGMVLYAKTFFPWNLKTRERDKGNGLYRGLFIIRDLFLDNPIVPPTHLLDTRNSNIIESCKTS